MKTPGHLTATLVLFVMGISLVHADRVVVPVNVHNLASSVRQGMVSCSGRNAAGREVSKGTRQFRLSRGSYRGTQTVPLTRKPGTHGMGPHVRYYCRLMFHTGSGFAEIRTLSDPGNRYYDRRFKRKPGARFVGIISGSIR